MFVWHPGKSILINPYYPFFYYPSEQLSVCAFLVLNPGFSILVDKEDGRVYTYTVIILLHFRPPHLYLLRRQTSIRCSFFANPVAVLTSWR